MAITPYSGTVPNRLSTGDNEVYATQVYNWLIYLDGTWVSTVNSTEVNINAKEASAVAAADTATTAANTATTAAATATSTANASLWVSGQSYTEGESAISLIDYQTYRATTATSGTTDPSLSADWTKISTPTNNTLTSTSTTEALSANMGKTLEDTKAPKANPIFTGLITEQVSVSTLTLGATSSIQTYTATGDATFTDGLANGQSLILRIVDGDLYAVTFPTAMWVGGKLPTLGNNDVFLFWKENSTLFANRAGTVSTGV